MISFPVHNFAPPPFAPLGLHWSPDSPGTLATDWNLLESRTRKTITSPLFHSLQSIMAYYHSIGVCVCVAVWLCTATATFSEWTQFRRGRFITFFAAGFE